MHFVDNVDLELALRWREIDLVAQFAYVFHAGVGGRIDLDQVHEPVLVDRLAVLALVAGPLGWVFRQAVDRLREQPRQRRLAGAARSRKQVRVPHTIGRDRVLEGLDDVPLSNHLVPSFGPVLAI